MRLVWKMQHTCFQITMSSASVLLSPVCICSSFLKQKKFEFLRYWFIVCVRASVAVVLCENATHFCSCDNKPCPNSCVPYSSIRSNMKEGARPSSDYFRKTLTGSVHIHIHTTPYMCVSARAMVLCMNEFTLFSCVWMLVHLVCVNRTEYCVWTQLTVVCCRWHRPGPQLLRHLQVLELEEWVCIHTYK